MQGLGFELRTSHLVNNLLILNEIFKGKFSYNFIDVDLFLSSNHVSRHLKHITLVTFWFKNIMVGPKILDFKIR